MIEIVAEWWDASEGNTYTGYWSVDIVVCGTLEKSVHRSRHLFDDYDECREWAREQAEEIAEDFDESVEDGTLDLRVEHRGDGQ